MTSDEELIVLELENTESRAETVDVTIRRTVSPLLGVAFWLSAGAALGFGVATVRQTAPASPAASLQEMSEPARNLRIPGPSSSLGPGPVPISADTAARSAMSKRSRLCSSSPRSADAIERCMRTERTHADNGRLSQTTTPELRLDQLPADVVIDGCGIFSVRTDIASDSSHIAAEVTESDESVVKKCP